MAPSTSEERSSSFTADLEEGTAYLLSLRMPSGDGVTIDGTIQFTANGSGSADSEIIKETIAAGETKTAVWSADVQTQYEYTFVPEESGNYRIFSEGGADTYVTLYSSEGEVREYISEDDDDGEGLFLRVPDHPLEVGPLVLRAGQGPVDIFADDLIAHPLRVGVTVMELALDALLRLAMAGIAGVDYGFGHFLRCLPRIMNNIVNKIPMIPEITVMDILTNIIPVAMSKIKINIIILI